MKQSLKGKIYSYLRSHYPDWVHKGEIGRLAVVEWGYENENAGRRCRELENEGLIEAKYEKNLLGAKCVLYRFIPIPEKTPEERQKEDDQILMQALF